MKLRCVMALSLISLSGCAIEPDSLRLEAVHTSHLLQHFENEHYGYDSVGIDAHWRIGHAYLDIGEYYSPPNDSLDHQDESFQARFGYEIPLKK